MERVNPIGREPGERRTVAAGGLTDELQEALLAGRAEVLFEGDDTGLEVLPRLPEGSEKRAVGPQQVSASGSHQSLAGQLELPGGAEPMAILGHDPFAVTGRVALDGKRRDERE